jgi:hypothetical protein
MCQPWSQAGNILVEPIDISTIPTRWYGSTAFRRSRKDQPRGLHFRVLIALVLLYLHLAIHTLSSIWEAVRLEMLLGLR